MQLQKNMGNVRKQRYIKLITTERRINYLESETNYHIKKFFTANLLAIELKKNPRYLRKIHLFRIFNTRIKEHINVPTKQAKLCCMNRDSFLYT